MAMDEKKCKKCGKIVMGYNPLHADFLMDQHNLTHRHDERVQEERASVFYQNTKFEKDGQVCWVGAEGIR